MNARTKRMPTRLGRCHDRVPGSFDRRTEPHNVEERDADSDHAPRDRECAAGELQHHSHDRATSRRRRQSGMRRGSGRAGRPRSSAAQCAKDGRSDLLELRSGEVVEMPKGFGKGVAGMGSEPLHICGRPLRTHPANERLTAGDNHRGDLQPARDARTARDLAGRAPANDAAEVENRRVDGHSVLNE